MNPAGVEWETATVSYDPSNYQVGYFKWTSPVTNRLLLEAGTSFNVFNLSYQTYLPGIRKPRGTPEWFAGAQRRDLVLNTFRSAPAVSELYAYQPLYQYSGSASYVTGSHIFKAGLQFRRQRIRNHAEGGNADLVQRVPERRSRLRVGRRGTVSRRVPRPRNGRLCHGHLDDRSTHVEPGRPVRLLQGRG